MTEVLERPAGGTITASVTFTVRDSELPVTLVNTPGGGPDDRTGTFVPHDIQIHDGRPIADQLDLDRQGFALRGYPTAVKDFYDDDEVRRVYYPEMERLIVDMTGASAVVIFDHTQRIDDGAAQIDQKVRGPAIYVHNDFTAESAAQRVRDLLPADEAEARLQKRYASINVWRPIKGPVETAPLAICEYGSIDDNDWVLSERHYGDRVGRIYHIAYNPDQRWTYFPHMQRDEVVLLKCYDSLTDGTAQWTAHGSFQPPGRRPDAPPRESIEIRSLLFFD